MKIEGNVEAFSKERKRVKIDGEWYDVAENVVDFLKKGQARIRIENDVVQFIEYLQEKSNDGKKLILYENLLRTAALITSNEKKTKTRLKKTLEVTENLVEYLKEKGVIND